MNTYKQLMKQSKAKYIFISGGVISGLGKGTVTASLATLLEGAGLKTFPIKVDMYLNIDAGTMNPLEHGETFVTEDGLECDQDIGTYERFLDRNTSRKNYFTAGQVYQSLLNKERQLKFDGACVEAFPHIPEEIIEFIHRYPKDTDVVLIEFGGTVGEYQNEAFFEAARMMAAYEPRSVCIVHVGYVPMPSHLGELKSKPLQMSIKAINELGIFPDLIVCRSETNIDKRRMTKIAQAAGLPEEYIFTSPDVESIYTLPYKLRQQHILDPIFNKFHFNHLRSKISNWESLYQKIENLKNSVDIAIIGKYYSSGEFSLTDSYISVVEALKHACYQLNFKPNIIWLDSEQIEANPKELNKLKQAQAVIVPQGWGSRGTEGKIKAIYYARKHNIPYLGLCFGMQLATIEFGRHVIGLKNANSEEINPKTPYPLIHIMQDQKEYIAKRQYGGTIRLGAWPCKIKANTLISKIYKKYHRLSKNYIIQERHRHRYEFNNQYRDDFEAHGFHLSGVSPDGRLVEAVELDKKIHPYFIGTQFHPELISRPFSPHPLFLGLISAAIKLK